MGLDTLANTKTFLGVSVTTNDTVITQMIEAATELMELECGRHLASTSVTEILDGTGKEGLWLKEPPETMTSVTEDTEQDWTGGEALTVDTDYLVRGCKLERLDNIWLEAQACYRIIYLGGFATVPEDLKFAMKAQVAKLYSEWLAAKKGLNILASHNVHGWSQQFLGHAGLDPYVAAVVRRYEPGRL